MNKCLEETFTFKGHTIKRLDPPIVEWRDLEKKEYHYSVDQNGTDIWFPSLHAVHRWIVRGLKELKDE